MRVGASEAPASEAPAAAVGVVVFGALVVIAATFLAWARIDRVTFVGGDLLGTPIGGAEDIGLGMEGLDSEGDPPSAPGYSDATGLSAAVVALGAGVGALMLASRSRALAGLAAMAGGVLVIVSSLVGLFGAERIAVEGLRDAIWSEADVSLGLPFAGGLLDRMVDGLLGLFRFDTSPGVGVFVVLGGGVILALGGALYLPSGPAPEAGGGDPGSRAGFAG